MPNDAPIQKRSTPFRSVVVAKFVDDFPEVVNPTKLDKTRTQWETQPGVKEAFTLAMQNPKRALLMLEYTHGSASRRKNQAELRVKAFVERQGYTEDNGWVIKAVDGKVYVMYTGAR